MEARAILFTACMALLAASAAGQKKQATLDETVAWLEGKTPQTIMREDRAGEKKTITVHRNTFNGRGDRPCVIKVWTTTGVVGPDESWSMPVWTTVDFAELNPDGVEVLEVQGSFMVRAHTTNSREVLDAVMQPTGSMAFEGGKAHDFKSSSVSLSFETKEMADRYKKALVHAIQLCGGEKEAF